MLELIVLVNAKHIRDLSNVENEEFFRFEIANRLLSPRNRRCRDEYRQRVEPFFHRVRRHVTLTLGCSTKTIVRPVPSRHPLLTASTKPHSLPRPSLRFRAVAL